MISIYTDGSANARSSSPAYRLGGMAAVFVVDGKVTKIIHKGYRNTKTGRMELRAALTALQVLGKDQTATIYSDSEYVVKSFTEHRIERWELENWPCANADLMKELLSEFRKFRSGAVKFRHVKGHSTNEYNNLADHHASYKNFKEYEQDIPNGFGGEILREEIDVNENIIPVKRSVLEKLTTKRFDEQVMANLKGLNLDCDATKSDIY